MFHREFTLDCGLCNASTPFVHGQARLWSLINWRLLPRDDDVATYIYDSASGFVLCYTCAAVRLDMEDTVASSSSC
jgi:hypothetical protein